MMGEKVAGLTAEQWAQKAINEWVTWGTSDQEPLVSFQDGKTKVDRDEIDSLAKVFKNPEDRKVIQNVLQAAHAAGTIQLKESAIGALEELFIPAGQPGPGAIDSASDPKRVALGMAQRLAKSLSTEPLQAPIPDQYGTVSELRIVDPKIARQIRRFFEDLRFCETPKLTDEVKQEIALKFLAGVTSKSADTLDRLTALPQDQADQIIAYICLSATGDDLPFRRPTDPGSEIQARLFDAREIIQNGKADTAATVEAPPKKVFSPAAAAQDDAQVTEKLREIVGSAEIDTWTRETVVDNIVGKLKTGDELLSFRFSNWESFKGGAWFLEIRGIGKTHAPDLLEQFDALIENASDKYIFTN